QREIPQGARPRGALRRFLHLQLCDLGSMIFSSVLFKALRRFPRRASLIAWLSGSTNLWVALRSGAFRMPQYDANHFVNAAGVEVLCHIAKPCHAFPHPRYPVGGTAAYLRAQYEAAGTWRRFLAVREAVDPDGVFLNGYLRSWFYPDGVEASRALQAAA